MSENIKHEISVNRHTSGYGWYCSCGRGKPNAYCRSEGQALASARRHIK